MGGLFSSIVTLCWCNQDAQAPPGHTLKSDRGEPLALLPQMLGSTGIPSLWLGNLQSSGATRTSPEQEPGSIAGPDGQHLNVPC